MSDSVGSVSVDVVPDARGWAEKLRAQIRDTTIHAKVDMETTEAEAKLDELIAKEDVAARTRHGKVDVDTNSVSRGASALDGFLGKLGLLPALALTAGSALIPLAATAGGLVAALAAPLAFAGGGAGLFALLGGLAANQTEKQLKTIDQLRVKLQGLTKGTAEYAQVQKQLHDAEAALTPQQRQFAAAQDTLTGAFQKFLAGPGGQSLLSVMAQGMTVLSHLLPVVSPLIVSVGNAVSTLLGQVDNAGRGQEIQHFIAQVSHLVGPELIQGGHILGHLAAGVGSLLLVLGKHLSPDVLNGIDKLAGSFEKFATSKQGRQDVRDFIDYFHRVGPQVADTIGHVAHALGRVVEALAPLGPPVLHIISGIADAIGGIPVPVLTALAGTVGSLVALQKLGGFKALGLLTGGSGNPLTGGGGIIGRFGKGVVPVYVVNMDGGNGGGIGDFFRKYGKYGAEGGEGGGIGAVVGIAGVAAVAAGTAFTLWKAWQYESQPGKAPNVGGMTPAQHLKFDQQRIASQMGLPDPYAIDARIQSRRAALDAPFATTTKIDTLRASLAKASRQIDLIGPHADAAFGAASKDVDTFAGKLNAIHDKKFSVFLQDQAAVQALERLQQMRIADKNFNIYAHYQQVERAVGPGGGMGQNPHGSQPAPRVDVHVHGHIDEKGYVSSTAQDVYNQNQRFAGQHQ